ncbi:SDR family oxidoreductase [Ponticaulis sp.]|uniref:SDR family NAD(P)-dependent oxidoreductase n=1 Tax=Ponticaulis sp. TaxID=2020902 RepID=UPI0025FDBB64|nr:SDR family oxidoreductase [Ponticaulis sp.]
MRKLALITGASAGIGHAFAEHYAAQGFDVALVARRGDRLAEISADLKSRFNIETLIVVSDLSAPDAPERILEEVSGAGRHVDVLINNAGFGLPGVFAETRWEDQRNFIQLMFTAPLELCHRLLPGMIERRYGRIINVASLVSFLPGGVGHTLYGPVKSGLMRFSESLNAETEGTGVHVTALCPGLTFSEFHDVNGQRARVSKTPGIMWQTADRVVELGVRAVENNRAVIVTGFVNKCLAVLGQVLPGGIARSLMKAQSADNKGEGDA